MQGPYKVRDDVYVYDDNGIRVCAADSSFHARRICAALNSVYYANLAYEGGED